VTSRPTEQVLARVFAITVAIALLWGGIHFTLHPLNWMHSRGFMILNALWGGGYFCWYGITGERQMPPSVRVWWFSTLAAAYLGFGILGFISGKAHGTDVFGLWLCIVVGAGFVALAIYPGLLRTHGPSLQRP
jgi:hypothetical protein